MPQQMKRAIEIPTRPGKAEVSQITLPLRAPWIILDQHSETPPGIMETWEHFKEVYKEQLTETLDLKLGSVVYQHDGRGGIELAAYHYDTSD